MFCVCVVVVCALVFIYICVVFVYVVCVMYVIVFVCVVCAAVMVLLWSCVQVRVAVGQTVLILASQHLQTVLTSLVNQPLPYDRYTQGHTTSTHRHTMNML